MVNTVSATSSSDAPEMDPLPSVREEVGVLRADTAQTGIRAQMPETEMIHQPECSIADTNRRIAHVESVLARIERTLNETTATHRLCLELLNNVYINVSSTAGWARTMSVAIERQARDQNTGFEDLLRM